MDIHTFTSKRYETDNPNFKDDLREFAELCATMHYAVATSENPTISLSGALGGKIYPRSQRLLIEAIRAAYVSLPATDIYEVWVDCNESIAYCASVVKNRLAENECEGHESLNGDMMGESVFCDGSCVK